jgi:hypothetical protein
MPLNFDMLIAGFSMTVLNILVKVGMNLSINLDKPNRARKVGNELNG